MRHMIGYAAVLLAAGVLLLGNVAIAQSAEAKDDKSKAAKQDPEAQKASADKTRADETKAKESPAKQKKQKKSAAKPAEEAKPAAQTESKPASETKPVEKEKPAVHTVKAELIKVELDLKGVLEGKAMAPISVQPEEWKTLLVDEGVEHGAEVEKGDVLVRFETDKIDEAIDDQTTSIELAKLGLKQAQESLKALEETTPMDLEYMERAKREAQEDQKRYFEVDRPMNVRYAAFSLKSYEEGLENEQEELRQLEKMYKADDLTEETEEIVLKRQRSAVERAKFYLEMAKLRNEETLKITLPRMDVLIREQTRRQEIASATAKVTLPTTLNRQRLDVERMKIELARSEDRLKKLKKDREQLTVRAPISGVVYYGKYVRGSWSGGTSTADAMLHGGKVSADEVFMTVVQPQPLAARVTVPESDLHWIQPGLKGVLTPTGYPDLDIDCSVTAVEHVPLSGSSLGATLRVNTNNEALLPGMAVSVEFVPYLKKRALAVPAKTVFTDEVDSRKKYVYLAVEDGKPKRQDVKVGQKSGDNLEILDGLVAGDKVLLEKPEDEK